MFLPILLGVGALAYLMLHNRGPAGHSDVSHQVQNVPVMFGDDKTVAPTQIAVWHSTDDQTRQFGPRFPAYWNLNGYFMFDNGRGGYDKYKPDWQVPVKYTGAA